ncbi:hypothetical protein ARMGADRAFT_795425 [Armillaria gallica]|uniref:Uncharacterized protein n=1 Tax=Armillaria gallica TaxID=47427 RepID=A0A2H3DN65_ARMGA|nr:hypothetical protein ARMGADRAFT_795425 [Armillaria gallica]
MERCPQARAVGWDTVFGEQGASRPQHLQHGEPSPNWCTCTNVFFNIWSACLMSQGNYSLTSDQWQSLCEQQKLRISTSKRSVGDQDHVPMWAYAEMPVNQTFNIRQATDYQSSSWSRYQIITIVAISCSVLGVAAILLFLYRWRSLWARHHGVSLKGFSFKSFKFPRFPHGPKKVRSDSRDNNWAIDEVEALDDYQYVPTPSTSRSGHIRLSSTPTPYDGPARRTWYIRSQDFFRKTRNKFLDISEYIPRPWRTKPVHVKALSRDMLFDIDGTALSTKTDSTLENYRTAGKQVYAAQAEPGPRRFSRYSVMDNESYISNNGEDQPGFEADSEQERLITPSEEFPEPPPSVLLISQGGRDFTLESGESRSQQHHAVSHEGEVPVASSSRQPEPPAGVKVRAAHVMNIVALIFGSTAPTNTATPTGTDISRSFASSIPSAKHTTASTQTVIGQHAWLTHGPSTAAGRCSVPHTHGFCQPSSSSPAFPSRHPPLLHRSPPKRFYVPFPTSV